MARKCLNCRKKFTPKYSSLQSTCSPKCAIEHVKRENKKAADKQAKADRKAHREAKEKLRTKRDWIKLTQPVFNRWIRLRDHDQPCISCGRYDHEIPETYVGGKWDCGHFLTVGAYPELRFEPLNAHKQCKICNAGSGKYTRKNHTVTQSYRENLILRIGLDKVEWLEGPHDPKHYTIESLKEIKQKYAKMTNELTKNLKAQQ